MIAEWLARVHSRIVVVVGKRVLLRYPHFQTLEWKDRPRLDITARNLLVHMIDDFEMVRFRGKFETSHQYYCCLLILIGGLDNSII
jgi:hypothetical protein